MLIITISPSTSATSTEGLREIVVVSVMPAAEPVSAAFCMAWPAQRRGRHSKFSQPRCRGPNTEQDYVRPFAVRPLVIGGGGQTIEWGCRFGQLRAKLWIARGS